METPIKHLLNTKVLSPLSFSPVVGATKKFRIANGYSPLQKNISGTHSLAKTLNFPISPNKLGVNNHVSLIDITRKFDKKSNILVKVTDYGEESLLINTPNKNKLMKDGLSLTTNLKILGKGSFGTVVRGIYKGEHVAVKIVKLNKNNLFLIRESNILHMNHQNLVQIIDVIHKPNTEYGIIIMDYSLFSRHLQSILDDKNVILMQEIIVKYALDVCRGLQYCHENGVLHLDLKPSNVLVCEGNLCKLCDFGNSVRLGDCRQLNTHQGTVAYAAPEMLLGEIPTSKCDIYSLGILLWQMRYRETPYSELDGMEVVIYKNSGGLLTDSRQRTLTTEFLENNLLQVVKFHYRPHLESICIQDEYFSIYSMCWAASPADRPNISYIIHKLQTLF